MTFRALFNSILGCCSAPLCSSSLQQKEPPWPSVVLANGCCGRVWTLPFKTILWRQQYHRFTDEPLLWKEEVEASPDRDEKFKNICCCCHNYIKCTWKICLYSWVYLVFILWVSVTRKSLSLKSRCLRSLICFTSSAKFMIWSSLRLRQFWAATYMKIKQC